MGSEYQWVREACGAAGDIEGFVALAERLQHTGDFHTAAIALDRAFGLDPNNAGIRSARQKLLDQLSLIEHGISFRYIPGGSFLMGSDCGDADERPVHPVELNHYWLSETPISWACYCRLMGWELPPAGIPKGTSWISQMPDKFRWQLSGGNKIRVQYCEDETQRAMDWHAHMPANDWKDKKSGEVVSSRTLFGAPQRSKPSRIWTYEKKPMVCVSYEDAERLCATLSMPSSVQRRSALVSSLFRRKDPLFLKMRYRLPTEAEWEKAARGGLNGCDYPWGSNPPTNDICDFNRFDQFSVLPMKNFGPNGYGLYAVSGGVWEWAADWYDAEYYAQSPSRNPRGPSEGKKRVARGGSWSDCAEAVTVSFRMAMGGEGTPSESNPNVGFRLCRVENT